ncbi:MAG TPA: bifunctional adenosylcobinamide kinase/adenosylcobinamide-phosphate guanylyltransferase [Clostridia bacterium]|nr:bifunctional adenosylcobinamide kinase/adenosylcobinamide-phosphate guanylyltransferase [Clostridia bacterium]
MSKIITVTGGARSGKSSFGEALLKKSTGKKGYIATATPFDDGMRERIKKHKNSRPKNWETFELPYEISSHIKEISVKCDIVILDCITVFSSNILFEKEYDWEKISYEKISLLEEKIIEEIQQIVKIAKESDLALVIITNEVGSGIVPGNRLSRVYRDIAGRINQKLSQLSDEVYVTISGIPLKLK